MTCKYCGGRERVLLGDLGCLRWSRCLACHGEDFEPVTDQDRYEEMIEQGACDDDE